MRPLRSANEYDIEFSVLTVWSRQIILISVDLPLVIRVHFEFVQTRSRVRVKPMFEIVCKSKRLGCNAGCQEVSWGLLVLLIFCKILVSLCSVVLHALTLKSPI